ATDIDLTYLQRLNGPNLEVRKHNILDDPLDALGPGSFDLVCSRLMLFWLAGKQEAAIPPMGAGRGGRAPAMTPPLDASSRCCSSVAAWRTSATRQRPKLYAVVASGRD